MRLLPAALLFGALSTSLPLFAADVQVQVLQDKLDHPWSVAFLPDNQTLLITERSGQLRSWQPGKGLSPPIGGVPKVWANRQGGLLDVVLAPDFAESRRVWLSYTTADASGRAGGVVGYGRLSDDNRQLSDFKVVLEQTPKLSGGANIGTRLAFDRQGFLYIAFGDNFASSSAQQLDKLSGKIVRLTKDGEIPPDNPFVDRQGARAEIWSYGMRNPQGLALNPWTQQMWESEHGRAGVMRSTSPRRAKITAGRWRRTALITAGRKCRKQRVVKWKALSNRCISGKSRRPSAAWRSTTARVSHSGKIHCLLVR